MNDLVITIRLSASGALALDGPDLVQHRQLYDHLFNELQRRIAIGVAKQLEGQRIVPVAASAGFNPKSPQGLG